MCDALMKGPGEGCRILPPSNKSENVLPRGECVRSFRSNDNLT